MSDHTPSSPPRRCISLWLAAAALLFSALLCGPLLGQEVPLVVSRETTYITEPLGPDGLPDYEQYLLDQQKKGVTPENNAAVLLWQVIWPGDLEPDEFAAMAKELGLKDVPTGENSLECPADKKFLERLATWLKLHNKSLDDQDGSSDSEYSEQAELIVDQAMDHPWTSEQIPPLAKWVEDSRAALDLAVEASRRPRHYSSSPSYLDGQQTMLIAILFPDAQGVRNVAQALSIRAMQNLGEGHLEKAWDDLLAIHRLALLEGQQGTLVEQIVAISIDQIACSGTVALLSSRELKKKQALQIQKDLAGLADFSSIVDVIDQTERMSALDAVLDVRKQGIDALGLERRQHSPAERAQFRAAFDWNVVLKDVNQSYDRLVAAAKVTDRSERAQQLSQIENDVTQAAGDLNKIANIISSVFSTSDRSHSLSNAFIALFVPATSTALVVEDRANTALALTRLAAALAVYRAEHGEYPDSLDTLVPDVLPKLPIDLYRQLPFIYQRDSDGYLLYTAGPNGVDDDGSNDAMDILEGRRVWNTVGRESDNSVNGIPDDADDISIRVPTPPFKLPERSVGEPDP